MLANSGAYAELIARYPVAGGEFVFARAVFGDRTGFFVGWLWTLSLIPSRCSKRPRCRGCSRR